MKIERKTHTSKEISTSSMPDIIFMLLIFFMVTTVMREYEGLDIIMPRAKMIEKLESKRHTSYVWATKDGLVSVDDRIINIRTGNLGMVENYNVGILTVILRKNYFLKLKKKFDDRFSIIGDFDLFLRLSKICLFESIKEPLAFYRLHSKNLSTLNKERRLRKLRYGSGKINQI